MYDQIVENRASRGSNLRLEIIYRSPDMLVDDERNPRRHSLPQLRQLQKSIESFGFIVPVIVDNNFRIIGGHACVAVARKLGLAEIPIIRIEHLTDAQKRACMLALNRLSELSDWDPQILGEILQELSLADLDFDIEATGFFIPEIDLRIEGLGERTDELDAADVVPSMMMESPVSTAGDLWLMGRHRLLCGSALDSAAYVVLMNGEPATAMFTDPPYNVAIDGNVGGLGKTRHREFAMASGEMSKSEFIDFQSKAYSLAAQHSVDGAIHYICMDWRHMGEVLAAQEGVYTELKNVCVWAKPAAGMGSFYRSQHELVFVCKHGHGRHRNNIELGRHGRNRTNVWQYASPASFGRTGEEGRLLDLHPTVKPVTMVADAILDCTARGEIILDPFLGSGTTLIAAEKMGRRCFGMEIDPLYVDTIIRRWQAWTGDEAVLASTGRSFAQVTSDREAGHAE